MNELKERPRARPAAPPRRRQGTRTAARRRRNKTPPLWRRALPLLIVGIIAVGAVAVSRRAAPETAGLPPAVKQLMKATVPSYVQKDVIDVDGTSRRGEKLEDFTDVVIHYVGNPGTTARQNRDFYANPDSDVSSHFVVGLEGEVIQCVPLDEKSSATSWRNGDTISIEVCHPDETGQFGEASYQSLVKLTAWLLDAGGLPRDHVLRHYDVTGKECPRYYVKNPDAWEQFRADVAAD